MEHSYEKKNQVLFIIFKSFTYDLLFYYTLETMFLTLVKGYSFSQVFLITSIDLFFITILSLPLNLLLSKISVLNRLRLGTISLIIYILAFILVNNIYLMCFFIIFKSIGNLIISVNSTELLGNLCNGNKNNEASKMEGQATASWWILEAISAIVSGYLFQINFFISYYINIGLLSLAFLATFFFKITNKNLEDNNQNKLEAENKKIKNKEYIKSIVIIAFIAFAFWGAAEVFGSSAKTFLQEIGTTSVLLGWIYFGVKIITATCNVFSYKIERKLGCKFLPFVIFLFLISVLLMGIIYFIEMTFIVKLILIIISVIIMYITRNPYRLNIKNTMITIFGEKRIVKVYSYYYLAENLGGIIFSLMTSLILDRLDLGWSIFINLSIIILILIPTLILYLKTFNIKHECNFIKNDLTTISNDEQIINDKKDN